MDDFQILLAYNGRELMLPAKLIKFGYSYRIEVDIRGWKVFFERDEEMNWRALLNTDH